MIAAMMANRFVRGTVGLLVIVLFVSTIASVNAYRPPADPHDCLAERSDLVEILDAVAPTVAEACQASGPFLANLLETLRDRPLDTERVWRTGDLLRDGSDEALASWRGGRHVQWVTGGAWQVPEDPDWAEDPYDNLTWLTRYHSLGWLTALARGYREGDHALGHQLRWYLLDWIADNPTRAAPSPRSWFDGSVRRRSESIVSMWDVLLEVLREEDLPAVLDSVHLHSRRLHAYLSQERFIGHNHNLFHALALYSLAFHLPELRGADLWRSDARARISRLMREMINPSDGVSTEQAAAYHYTALGLFASADEYLGLFGDGLTGDDHALLSEATRFGALLPDPTGRLPAIGDTSYGTQARARLERLEQLTAKGITTPETLFLLTRGQEGQRPADAVFFAGEGYAVFRPSYGERDRWEDDLHLVVDMGPSRRVHGHDDAMNVLLSAYGRQLLVDSGGPYKYGVPERAAFRGAAAHNTVVVDDGGYQDGEVWIERMIDMPAYSAISGGHDQSPGAQHRRTVLLVKPSLLIIIDHLTSTDGRPRRFDLLYHLPPEAEIRLTDADAVVVAEEAGLGLTVSGGQPLQAAVRLGEEEPLFGWVTRGNARREPAPVLTFTQHASEAWFVTVAHPSRAGDVAVPVVDVDVTADYARVAGPDGLLVEVPSIGQITVTAGE